MSKIVGCWCPKVQMSSTRLQQADSICLGYEKGFKASELRGLRSQECAQSVPKRHVDLVDILTEFRTNARSEQNAQSPASAPTRLLTPDLQEMLHANGNNLAIITTPQRAQTMWILNFSPPVTPANAHSTAPPEPSLVTIEIPSRKRAVERWFHWSSRIQLTSCTQEICRQNSLLAA